MQQTGGIRETLATKLGVHAVLGEFIALVDSGGVVSAWRGSRPSFEELLSASDSEYAGGYAGLSAYGKGGKLRQFKAGSLAVVSP